MKFVHGIIIAVGLLVAANLAFISEDLTKAEVMMAIGASEPVCEADECYLPCAKADECYVPYAVTVVTGGTVTWTNSDIGHTVTAGTVTWTDSDLVPTAATGHILADPPLTGTEIPGGFTSGIIQSGGTYSHTFEEAGEHPYFCRIHPWMQGVVIVW